MKKPLLLLFFIFLTLSSYSQIVFEKGYFIDNNNKKTECLIKNLDWRSNPTEFEYKLDEQDQAITTNIQQVKEFEIYNVSKYERQTVNIDHSKSNLSDMDYTKNPTFTEEKLFLQVLIAGKAALYEYQNQDLLRFFFKTETDPITQLIFKTYKVSESEIADNNQFKQQIFTTLKCDNITAQNIKYLEYKKSDLIKIFIKYNQCNSSDFTNYEAKEKKDLFNLNIRPGIKTSSLSVTNDLMPSYNTDFGSKVGFRLGLEAEFILPFNKNKWAIIVEPTYQAYKSEKIENGFTSKVDYSSIELPIGLRHYFFLNNTSKIFINGQYVIDKVMNSDSSFKTVNGLTNNVKLESGGSLAVGAGYNYKNKYNVEFRLGFAKDLHSTYNSWSSDYNSISLIFGYSIF
jgi:ribosomal protein S18